MGNSQAGILCASFLAACAGPGAGPPSGGPPPATPVFGVTVELNPAFDHPTFDRQLGFCREAGIEAVRWETKLRAPGGVAAALAPAQPLFERAGTVLLAVDPLYARAYWPASEPAFAQDLDALASHLATARARVIVAVAAGPAWEEGERGVAMRRTLARLRAPGRIVAWEIDVPVGPEGPGAGPAEGPDLPAWRRPWEVYRRALEAAAASDLDAVAVRHYPHWEATHGRRPVPLAAYAESLRGILRVVRAAGKPVLLSEFGVAERDQRFALRKDVIAAAAKVVHADGALGAFYYALIGPDFGIRVENGPWRVDWRAATEP